MTNCCGGYNCDKNKKVFIQPQNVLDFGTRDMVHNLQMICIAVVGKILCVQSKVSFVLDEFGLLFTTL